MPSAGIGIMASSVVTGVCTDVLQEPFNNFTFAPWANSGCTIVAGRNGTALSSVGSASTATYTIPAVNESDTVTVGFAFKIASLATNRIVGNLRSDTAATVHNQIQIATTGQIIITGGGVNTVSATGIIAVATWYYFELQIKLHDSTGTVKVRVNGTEVINATGVDTKAAGTKTVYDALRLGPGGSSHTLLVDDFYLSTGAGCSFQGDHVVP